MPKLLTLSSEVAVHVTIMVMLCLALPVETSFSGTWLSGLLGAQSGSLGGGGGGGQGYIHVYGVKKGSLLMA